MMRAWWRVRFGIWASLSAALLVHLGLSYASWEWRLLFPKLEALLLIYWVTALPYAAGVVTAWSFGLLSDIVLGGSLLGLQAITWASMAYFSTLFRSRLRGKGRWTEFWIVSLIVSVGAVITWLLRHYWFRAAPPVQWYGWGVITSSLSWPLLSPLVRAYERWLLRQHEAHG